ncbi:MAG: hypothetical protein ACREBJ_00950 [Nitrosotalea sp.]
MNINQKFLFEAEKRFKKTCKMTYDISIFPMSNGVSNVETDKTKSKEFSEVFTPLWLVDRMIKRVKFKNADTRTLDLCAGYGQFSIRLMRYFNDKFPDWDVRKFIKENHAFSELQLSSCYKLLNTFGNKITLFIGDSTYLSKLPPDARGIWCYIESYGYWVCLTKTISDILSPHGIKEKPVSEAKFVSSIELIVKGLNEKYSDMKDMYNLTLNQMTPTIRMELISQANKATKNNSLQSVDTPFSLVDEMLDKVDDLEKKSILVLFNCEIVERLITKGKVDPKNITFAFDSGAALKSAMMKKMYGVEVINFSSDVVFMHSAFKGRKFDVVFTNPPYNDNIDLKILMALFNGNDPIAKEFVIVHPSIWLIDIKAKDQLYNNFKAAISKNVKSIDVFNGNKVFGVFLFVPCVITHINFDYVGDITVKYFEEEYMIDKLNAITKFGKSWLSIVKPFANMIDHNIATMGNVWEHNVSHLAVNASKYYCQLACIRGNVSKDPNSLINDDFYTMCINDNITNKGIRKTNVNRPKSDRIPTFEFGSDAEVDNFLSYLKTDFARFCLSIFKVNAHLDRGELSNIPWLDFAQTWDDEKLFKHFDINKETQDYIRNFLPDYYGIRK